MSLNDFQLPSGSDFVPQVSGQSNLGNPTSYFGNLYVNSINAGAITSTGVFVHITGDTLTGGLNGTSANFSTITGNTINASTGTITQLSTSSFIFDYGSADSGDVTIPSGVSFWNASSGIYFGNFTVSSGATLGWANCVAYVTGTFLNFGTIIPSGSAANGGNGGVAGTGSIAGTIAPGFNTAPQMAWWGGVGQPGGAGSSTVAQAGAAPAGGFYVAGSGGNGGAGGTGTGFAGGISAVSSQPHAPFFRSLVASPFSGFNTNVLAGQAGGSGGSGGGGGVSSLGAGGGAGGTGGAGVYIAARNFNNAGSIVANGGNGGNGAVPTGTTGGGGGAGGGGGGGFIYLVSENFINVGTLTVNPGIGGQGGAGVRSTGVSGGNGSTGTIFRINTLTGQHFNS